MSFRKLLSLLLASAMLIALLPLGILPPSASAEQSREARIKKLIDFSERKHEMQRRSAIKLEPAEALEDPYASARIIVKSEKQLDYDGSVDHVNGYNDWHIIQYSSPDAAKKAAEEYRRLDYVEYAAPDAIRTIAQQPHVNSFLSWGYGPDHVGAFNYNEWLLEGGVTVDQLPEIRVAVIDTGISASHPFLEGRVLDVGYDFANGDSNPDDDHYHGTHVAGTVVDGTMPNVKVAAIKVLDSGGYGSDSDIISGFEYAHLNGFHVANASLRGPRNDDIFNMYTDIINEGTDAGTIYCVASGNDGGNANNWVPGCVERACTVAAHDEQRRMADFSNIGTCVDITAPGVNIRSCVPGGGYENLSGTSMATPHVSAACAMVKSFAPDMAADDVIQTIKRAAVDEGLVGGGDGLLMVADLFKYDVVLNGEGSDMHFVSEGNYPWIIEDGAVHSGNAGVNGSTSIIKSSVRLGAFQRISFSYKVSSQQNCDFLRFKVDGQTVFETSGNVDWQEYSYIIPGVGARTLTWEFSKDSSLEAGSDMAWLANVVLEKTVNTVVNVGEDPLNFETGGSYPWSVDGDAAKSGNAGVNSSVSELSASRQLTAGMSITFFYKTRCGAGDRLELLVNGRPELTVTASTEWTAFEYEITANGSYTFTFRYVKDASGALGDDCAWVKGFRLLHSLSSALNVDGGRLVFGSEGQYPWIVDGVCAKSGNSNAHSSESTVTLTVSMNAGDRLCFRAKVSSEQSYDKYVFRVNGQQQFERSGEVNWFDYTYTAQQSGTFTFTWTYTKDYSVSYGLDEAYLDDVRLETVSGSLPGDSNDNGTVEVADALLAMRYAMGLLDDSALNVLNADMDGSGTVLVADAVMILRLAIGL